MMLNIVLTVMQYGAGIDDMKKFLHCIFISEMALTKLFTCDNESYGLLWTRAEWNRFVFVYKDIKRMYELIGCTIVVTQGVAYFIHPFASNDTPIDSYHVLNILAALSARDETVVPMLIEKLTIMCVGFCDKDSVGETLLHHIANGQVVPVKEFSPEGIVTFRPLFNVPNRFGETPFMWIVRYCSVATFHAMINEGADAEITDKHGMNAFDWAFMNGNEQVVEAMKKLGLQPALVDV